MPHAHFGARGGAQGVSFDTDERLGGGCSDRQVKQLGVVGTRPRVLREAKSRQPWVKASGQTGC